MPYLRCLGAPLVGETHECNLRYSEGLITGSAQMG